MYATPMRIQKKTYGEDSFGFDKEFKGNGKPFETYTNYRSNNITPMQLDRNGNTLTYDHREGQEKSNRTQVNGNNVYDMFLKNTMNKLEATESKNNYLKMQKKFVKKALVTLSNKLCDQDATTINK